jgi:gluconate kinase
MTAGVRARVDVLLIGGRPGSGKTTVALEISSRLQVQGIAHCHIEGDNLDAAYPKPAEDPQGSRLTETNLTALWHTYAGIGQHRLIYVNTVSVVERDLIVRAIGGEARVVAVLLTATDETVHHRLARREAGSGLSRHLARSRRVAETLEQDAPESTYRVTTDARTVHSVAAEVIELTGWAGLQSP